MTSVRVLFITVKKVFVDVTDCPLDLRLAYLSSSLNNLLCPQSHFYLAEDNSVTEVSQLRTIRSVSRLSVITRFSRDALQHEKQKKESDCEKTKKGLICRTNNFMDFMHYFFTFISLPEFPCATSLYDVKRTEREIALLAQAHKTVFGLKNHSRDSCTLVHSQLCLPKSTVYGVANSNDYKKLAFPSSHSRIWYKMLINWSFVFRCEECYAEDCVCHSFSRAASTPHCACAYPSLSLSRSLLPSLLWR